jgi:hypothetical protein
VHAAVQPAEGGVGALYEAPRADVVAQLAADGSPRLELRLLSTPQQTVLERNPRAARSDKPRARDSVRLESLRLPDDVLHALSDAPPQTVLTTAFAASTPEPLRAAHATLVRRNGEAARKITGLIHFRLGHAISAIVTVVAAAALGVMFRGSRALSAFALACVPFAAISVLLVMGRQLTEGAATTHAGPYVVWCGLAAALLGNVLLVRAGVPR